MRLRLFVFDVAGTTVSDADNAVAGRIVDAFAAAGIDLAPRQVDPVMGMPKPLAIRALLQDCRGPAASDDEADRIHADFQRRMIAHYRTSPGVAPMPGAEALFAALREREIQIALDTGFDRPTLDAILDRLGWRALIDDSVTSDEVEHGRPAPDMILAAMARAGVTNSAQVGKIGDSVSDIEQGLAAECGLVVAMLSARTRPTVGNYPGVQAIENLAELLPLVDRINANVTA